MRKIRIFFRWMCGLGIPAAAVLRVTLLLSCACLAAALVFFLRADTLTQGTYELYHLARELYTLPQGLLLVGTILSAVLEEKFPGDR